ncbi:nudC domain-containing protein 3-like [Uloborus diversus]|uniref:nudC domain-containing protein 3-like n=1 Tax=Uloborus diversus TaxID=327109 RepID=UPI002409F1E2|nr:nudC domain-containing protein 3-like [Uloborus diversus]
MASEKNYDELLYPLLCSEGNIVHFFDRIFDFLHRRTDFFKIKREDSSVLGLLPGEAEKIIRSLFCKYMSQSASNEDEVNLQEDSVPIDFIAEEVVTTAEEDEDSNMLVDQSSVLADDMSPRLSGGNEGHDAQLEPDVKFMDPDSYNGARYEDYCWAQTIKDIDLRIKVPPRVATGKQVQVTIKQSHLKTEMFDSNQWVTLKCGDLPSKINVQESTWTLIPGEHIHICLQKCHEKWWDALFAEEPKIDLKTIDSSIAFEDLDQESQSKIEELMYNEHLKQLGKPTIQQSKVHNILKEAWNFEGSPFKGQPFDPSVLDIQNLSDV